MLPICTLSGHPRYETFSFGEKSEEIFYELFVSFALVAKDLVNWKLEGYVFPKGKGPKWTVSDYCASTYRGNLQNSRKRNFLILPF
jgi:hypothetical protein